MRSRVALAHQGVGLESFGVALLAFSERISCKAIAMGDRAREKRAVAFLAFSVLSVAVASSGGDRQLLSAQWTIGTLADPPPDSPICPALTKDHIEKQSVNNLVLVTVVDK